MIVIDYSFTRLLLTRTRYSYDVSTVQEYARHLGRDGGTWVLPVKFSAPCGSSFLGARAKPTLGSPAEAMLTTPP